MLTSIMATSDISLSFGNKREKTVMQFETGIKQQKSITNISVEYTDEGHE